MRDVRDEPALDPGQLLEPVDLPLQAGRHVVEGGAEAGQLVLAADPDPPVEVAGRDLLGGPGGGADGGDDGARDDERDDGDEEHQAGGAHDEGAPDQVEGGGLAVLPEDEVELVVADARAEVHDAAEGDRGAERRRVGRQRDPDLLAEDLALVVDDVVAERLRDDLEGVDLLGQRAAVLERPLAGRAGGLEEDDVAVVLVGQPVDELAAEGARLAAPGLGEALGEGVQLVGLALGGVRAGLPQPLGHPVEEHAAGDQDDHRREHDRRGDDAQPQRATPAQPAQPQPDEHAARRPAAQRTRRPAVQDPAVRGRRRGDGGVGQGHGRGRRQAGPAL